MIIIEKLKLRNFGSYGDNITEIDFLKTRTTLVVGPNGRGKSTPFTDALMYVLFNRPFRKVNKSQLINMITGKNLWVECTFTVGSKRYIVRRGMKPTIFDIFENDQLLAKPADDRDYQKMLEKNILRMTPKAFEQVVIIGKANYVPFLNLPSADRRKVVEDLLDLDVFSQMNKLLKADVDANAADLTGSGHALALLETTITQKRKAIDAIQSFSDGLIKQTDEQIEANKRGLAIVDEAIALNLTNTDKIVEVRKHYEKQVAAHTKYLAMEDKARTLVNKFADEIKFYEHNDSCSHCKQEITTEFKVQKIADANAKLGDIKSASEQLMDKLAALKSFRKQLAEASDAEMELDDARSSLVSDQRTYQSMIKKLEAHREELVAPKQDSDALTNDLAELHVKLVEANERRKVVLKRKEVLDESAKFLKDGGIKARIIKQYIPKMNRLLKKYLTALDFDVSFELDENFDEKVSSRNMEGFTFNAFSEGEKQRIEMALLFTWRELARDRSSSEVNLLVLDETFDSSMDSQGGDDILSILKQDEGSNIVVISHRVDAYLEKFDRTLTITKRKSFSNIKES